MAVNPAAIAQGAVSSYVTGKATDALAKTVEGNQPDPVIQLLTEIRDAIAPPEKTSKNDTFQLMAYPSEYIVPDDFYEHAHVCVFFFGSNVPVRFDGVFGGSYTRNVGPGWFQLDVPGRLSVQAGNSQTTVTVSYRDDALGSSF